MGAASGLTAGFATAFTRGLGGGAAVFGGRGTVVGTLIGAVIIGVFRNGLVQMGLDSSIQWGVTGALIIVAVAIDQLLKKRR